MADLTITVPLELAERLADWALFSAGFALPCSNAEQRKRLRQRARQDVVEIEELIEAAKAAKGN